MNKVELAKIKQKALEDHIPIIMDDTLEVIEKELKENKPKRILEIGTAVGYSAICFSEFLQNNGIIDTIDVFDGIIDHLLTLLMGLMGLSIGLM